MQSSNLTSGHRVLIDSEEYEEVPVQQLALLSSTVACRHIFTDVMRPRPS